MPYRQLEAEGYRLPVLEVSRQVPAARRLRRHARASITLLREKPLLRIRLEYEVRRGDELLATGVDRPCVHRPGRAAGPAAGLGGRPAERRLHGAGAVGSAAPAA